MSQLMIQSCKIKKILKQTRTGAQRGECRRERTRERKRSEPRNSQLRMDQRHSWRQKHSFVTLFPMSTATVRLPVSSWIISPERFRLKEPSWEVIGWFGATCDLSPRKGTSRCLLCRKRQSHAELWACVTSVDQAFPSFPWPCLYIQKFRAHIAELNHVADVTVSDHLVGILQE